MKFPVTFLCFSHGFWNINFQISDRDFQPSENFALYGMLHFNEQGIGLVI